MAETKVIMPQMGESIFEGTLTKWLKKQGDKVQRDEPLFEISTDKVDSEIPSPAAGILEKILVQEGQTVQINTVVAVIGDGSGKPAESPAPSKKETKPEPQKAETKAPAKKDAAETRKSADLKPAIKEGPAPIAGPAEPKRREEAEESAGAGESEEIRSSPLVRRIAKEHGIDLSALAGRGTGIDGRITKSDIL